jgi:hypothetical protein
MNANRFWHQQPEPHPRDSEIIRKATRLKIELYADKDGDLHGEFSVSGGFGMFGEDEYGNDDDKFARQQSEALRFVRGLLTEFERKRDQKGGLSL